MTNSPDTDSDAVAIVGMSGRFPGAADLAQFWANLRDGTESIARFSRSELAEAGIPATAAQHPAFVNAGGVLDDAELFDASFFGISAREAEVLEWEGKDASGRIVGPGRYTYRLSVTDTKNKTENTPVRGFRVVAPAPIEIEVK